MEFTRKLGRRIRQIRLERGLSLADVAFGADPQLSRSHLQNIESGKRDPSLRVLIAIARRLDVEPFELLVFPDGDLLDDVVSLAAQLSPQRLRALRRALKDEAVSR